MALPKLINFQSAFVDMPEFENEFKVMQLFRELPEAVKKILNQTALDWMNGIAPQKNPTNEEASQNSKTLREQGNKMFKESGKENVLGACRLYTKAIFAATKGSEALALAHANRAIALQEFGYFQQAYDDCECALEQGYPNHLKHKIITRQAYCAQQMEDAVLLKQHLDTLQELSLNQNFIVQLEKLQKGLEKLQICKSTTIVMNKEPMGEMRETQKILTNATKGRHMIAQKSIKEGELLFSERAFSFVPSEEWRVCQQCAATQLIPFPCYQCRGKVVYCSVKCRNLHHSHAFECVAYQKNLFPHIGIAHLALRMTLNGLPQIAPMLNEKSVTEIWYEMTNENSILFQSDKFEYINSLRMMTHLNKMTTADQTWFALVSKLLVLYLRKFTNFFNTFDRTKLSLSDWELVTASLILRHIGQLIVNAHVCISFVHISLKTSSDPLDFALMANNLWQSPYHVHRGYLHQFSDHLELIVANFPYLSMCNHACVQSFQPRFSGRHVSAFSTKNIPTGEEIFNCYTLDYRKSKKKTRWRALHDTYNFECICEKCDRENADEDYEKFHLYRCENSNCLKIFTPYLPNLDTLNWWEMMEDSSLTNDLKCTHCQTGQTSCLSVLEEFGYLLDLTDNPAVRKKLLELYKSLERWLIDYNELKLIYGLEIVTNFFATHNAGSLLSDNEFLELSSILKFCLRTTIEKNRINSIEYAVKMTYLWDIIALGKYVCNVNEMQVMMQAIEIVSDEMKTLLMNYYNDFLMQLIRH